MFAHIRAGSQHALRGIQVYSKILDLLPSLRALLPELRAANEEKCTVVERYGHEAHFVQHMVSVGTKDESGEGEEKAEKESGFGWPKCVGEVGGRSGGLAGYCPDVLELSYPLSCLSAQ
eukprot:1158757-Pelagomonas_calceolata.AAC.10